MDKHLPDGFNLQASIRLQRIWYNMVVMVCLFLAPSTFCSLGCYCLHYKVPFCWSGFYPRIKLRCELFATVLEALDSRWNLKLCFADRHQYCSFSLGRWSVAATAFVRRRPFSKVPSSNLGFYLIPEGIVNFAVSKAEIVCPAQAIPISWMAIPALTGVGWTMRFWLWPHLSHI